MSYKFDSLITILNKLDRGEKVTVHSLMDELEISERSVHRYLQTLQVAGFPVYFDKKRATYCFFEGYSLKRPDFTVEESLAFALAKKTLKNYGTGMEDVLDGLGEKLSLKQGDFTGHVIMKPERPSLSVEKYLGRVFTAITDFRSLEITYRARRSGRETVRRIDPYYVFFPDGFWTLRAYCHLRKEMRTFALDRICSLKVLDEEFFPCRISPEDELASSFGAWIDGKTVEVRLRFDAECRDFILRKKWHGSQEERELEDGRLEVSFRINGLNDIKHWIYRWIPHVEVVEPGELKEIIIEDMQKAVRKNTGR